MMSHAGSFRPPSLAKKHGRRGAVKVYAVIFGVCAIAFLNLDGLSKSRRSLSEAGEALRLLCRTVFDYPDWRDYWENLFPALKVYDGSGDQRASLPTDPHNIGYFVSIMSCPGDGYKFQPGSNFDPGHAFYDAAALLKYSITRNTYPAGSKYNATMYAVVHPSAVVCKSPNDDPYDRVKVLQDLGYTVTILGEPFEIRSVSDQYVKTNLANDAGDRDFIRLWPSTFDNHPAIVMVDFTTLMLKPIDNVFDQFISNSNLKIAYSMDYPDNLPATGANAGPNMNWIMMKPEPATFLAIQDSYMKTLYSPKWGWNNKGIKDFIGVLGVKGFLLHYFTRVEPGKVRMLDRCKYANGNEDPYGTDSNNNVVCKDPLDCRDCRAVPFDDIKVLKMIHTCGEPWKCSYDDTWDAATKATCEGYHRAWFSARIDFEESCWHNGPPSFRTGTFHEDVFLGFCTGPGILGYDRMIDDKSAAKTCDTDTQSSTSFATLDFQNGRSQDQKLTLTTGKVSGSTTACVSGTIREQGFEPPMNLGIVIDVSGSTAGAFGGTPTGDVNGDGSQNTILDAELGSILAVLESIRDTPGLSNDNVNIGLVAFSTEAKYLGQFAPLDPTDSTKINPALEGQLKAMRSGGYTHFDDALDKAITYFQEAPPDRSNLLFFLSDGIPNIGGDGDNEPILPKPKNNDPATLMYDTELAELDGMHVKRLAIGVGSGSDIRPGFGLDKIDNTPDAYTGVKPVIVTTTDELTEALLSNPVVGTVVDFSVSVNGASQSNINPSKVKSGPTGYSFGTFVVTNVDPHFGKVNTISVSATIDFDGNTGTTADQVTMQVSNELPGTLL